MMVRWGGGWSRSRRHRGVPGVGQRHGGEVLQMSWRHMGQVSHVVFSLPGHHHRRVRIRVRVRGRVRGRVRVRDRVR
jgi:hypothetical protein